MKIKELFVITFIKDYPFSDYKKIWAYNKDEALSIFEERCGIMKECVKYIETHDEWLQSDVG